MYRCARFLLLCLVSVIIAGCEHYALKPIAAGAVSGNERIAIVTAFADEAHFARMTVSRLFNTDLKIPAADWGVSEAAVAAATKHVGERYPMMTIGPVRTDFHRNDAEGVRDALLTTDTPQPSLPSTVQGRLADFLRSAPADLVVLIMSRWTPMPTARITPFAAVRVFVVRVADTARLGTAFATQCYDPSCRGGHSLGRWSGFAARYESWEAITEGPAAETKRELIASDVREAVTAAVEKALQAAGL